MGHILKEYAEERGYVLAAAYGDTPIALHYYYVKPGFPDAKRIVSAIRDVDYCWWMNGRRCRNYADGKDRLCGPD